MNKLKVYLGLVLIVLLGACEKEPDPSPVSSNLQYELTLSSVYGDQAIHPDSLYHTAEGYLIRFTDIRFYLSNMGSGGQSFAEVMLYDLQMPSANTYLKSAANNAFVSFQTFLGVDSTNNHLDPAAFPNNHPLNLLQANDMHWGWNPGYIFVRLEARVDTIPDAQINTDHLLSYHVGRDDLYKSIDLNNVPWKINGSKASVQIQFDVKQWLSAPEMVDIRNESSTHTAAGEENLFQKLANNFTSSLRLAP